MHTRQHRHRQTRPGIAALPAAVIVMIALSPPVPAAGPLSASSGPNRVALLELYTSQGCSSCPPADRFVSELSRRGPGPASLVALAFHVDYWDYLGWQDAYARREYSTRQRAAALRNGRRSVYTPQLLFEGRDLRNYNGIEAAARNVNALPAAASLRIDVRRSGDNLDVAVDGQVEAPQQRRTAELFLAVYENNLVRRIEAGENGGRVLHHDRVVQRLLGPVAGNDAGLLRLESELAIDGAWKVADLGVVAFVQNGMTGETLQVLELPLAGLVQAGSASSR